MIELRPLKEVLNLSFEEKMNYIANDISKKININQRGGCDNYRPILDIYKRLFNEYFEKPRGELNELRSAIKFKQMIPIIEEFSDVFYYAINLDRRICLDKNCLSPKIFNLGKTIGLKEEDLVNGCVIKYTSRAYRSKNHPHEYHALEDHFGKMAPISAYRKRKGIKAISRIISQKEFYKELVEDFMSVKV